MTTRQDRPRADGRQGGLGGVLPVVQTPYHPDETIDWSTLEAEVDWLFARGSDGLVMAMVSEVLRLTEAEREEMARRLCRAARGRGPVVISVGAESAFAAERFTRQAEAVGAAAVMAVPPVSIAALESDTLRYYERILAATTLPVIVQDASGYVGRPMSVELLARMQRAFGERIYFKPEATPIGPRLSALRAATGGAARIFEGSGGIALVDSYRRGIVGTMPGADLVAGIVALWQALRAGDEPRIYQLFLPIAALVALQSGLDGFLAVEKYLLVRQGVFRNTLVRGPRNFELDEETRGEVDRLFALIEQAVGPRQ